MQVKRHGKHAVISILLFVGCFVLLQYCKSKTTDSSGVRLVTLVTENAPKVECVDSLLVDAVDSICVVKHTRRMYVYNGSQLLKVYPIRLGTTPVGPKRVQGDRKTPEGLYYINGKNPNSMAHKNLGVSYPNDNDRKYARRKGCSPGGDIKIHGMVNGWEAQEEYYQNIDWTWGCIAVTNKDVDELYEYVEMGAPICILP